MQYKPTSNHVLVKEEDAPNQTRGGILLPQTGSDQRKTKRGVVVAVGKVRVTDNGECISPNCAVGDTVVYPLYAGNEFTDDDGTEYRLLRDHDVILVKCANSSPVKE